MFTIDISIELFPAAACAPTPTTGNTWRIFFAVLKVF